MVKKLVAVFSLAIVLTSLAGCVVQSQPTQAGNTIIMGPNNYVSGAPGNSITIKVGQTITFIDDKATGSPHILVIGMNGAAQAAAGAPDFGANGRSFQPDNIPWTTPPWTTAGTYHVSCTIHPTTMNLTVIVTA